MVRILIALVLAASVTLGLFYLMQALIKSGDTELSEPPKGSVLDFVRIKPEEQVQQKDRKPRKPPKPKEPPPPLEQPQLDSSDADTSGAAIDFSTDVSSDVDLGGGISLESSDGEYLPIVKPAAVYPRRALSRGIEGYVIVEFVVTKQGSVRDVSIVEANPQRIFDSAALEAAAKYKYKPRVINGEPTDVAGVQTKITFQLDG
jgi:protein TonB